jgi:uncharacterized protein YcnI
VDPASPSAGGFSQLTFKVPNESATAKTTRIAVALPTGTPFTSVSVKPMEGWTAEITEAALPSPVTIEGATISKAASAVTWTADEAHQLGQHEYQAFSISVGRLPAEGTTVALPATQWYSDGSVVDWAEPATPGQEQPKHPAPSFVTTAAKEGHGPAVLGRDGRVVSNRSGDTRRGQHTWHRRPGRRNSGPGAGNRGAHPYASAAEAVISAPRPGTRRRPL